MKTWKIITLSVFDAAGKLGLLLFVWYLLPALIAYYTILMGYNALTIEDVRHLSGQAFWSAVLFSVGGIGRIIFHEPEKG